MNYGRVLYESGKREVERNRDKSIFLFVNEYFICETIFLFVKQYFFYCSSLLDLNSQTAQNMKISHLCPKLYPNGVGVTGVYPRL